MSGVLSSEHHRERQVERDARPVERAESRYPKLLNAGRALTLPDDMESTWRAEKHQAGSEDVFSCSEGKNGKRPTNH
jgi:hypothetical protein